MKYSTLLRSSIAVAVTLSAHSTFASHDLAIELVEVTAEAVPQVATDQLFSETPVTRPTHDAGELLRSVSGMTALRRGGRGFEPIIRGQSQTNLNVISNGAFNFGACPGRMDPPSTYIGVDSFDSVKVIKGHRSVVHGAGGSGGTLLFEHLRPDFSKRAIQGSITSGYTSNSDLKSLAADLAVGNEKGYFRFFGSNKSSANYEDGNGANVASAFESDSVGLVAGVDVSESDYLELSHERSYEDDVWYAGNGMDAVYADSASTSLKWLHSSAIGPVDELQLTLYRSDVKHLMDNYTVRNRSLSTTGAAAPSSSDTWGGRLLASLDYDLSQWRIGMDYLANDRNATLYMDMGKDGSYDLLAARMWPDAQQRQAGIFAELDYRYSDVDTLRLGVRWDKFESAVKDATLVAGMMGSATPITLYQSFYGSSKTDEDHTGVSLVLGWDRKLDVDTLLSLNISRSVRTPDASEQWIARSAMGAFWVGNPELKPEIHQQLDVTWMKSQGRVDWSVTAFRDEVSDFIERYKMGSADLYRNIDATLYGFEGDAKTQVTENLHARLGLSYTRGHGDYGDLAQIAPLEARINLDYSQSRWTLGAEWVLSARQSHFDQDVDVNEPTAGFGVLHLYGHWSVTDQLIFEAGIENLFDSAYAYHVNAANSDPFNPEAVRVNEPGRQSWVKVRYQF